MVNEYQELFKTIYDISIEDLAYFAGLFDGEGWVIAKASHRSANVGIGIGNTNKAILEWTKQRFGGRIYDAHSKSRKNKLWHWLYSGKKALPLLKAIEPLLKVKAGEVRLAIEMLEYIHPRGGHITESLQYFGYLEAKAKEIKLLKGSYKISVN